MNRDLYATLGLKPSAKEDDIRKAYRKLARKYHPDVNPGDAVAEDKFKRVAAACDVLSDAKKRKAYDEFGEDSLKSGFDADKAREYRAYRSQPGQSQPGRGGADRYGGGGNGAGFAGGNSSQGDRGFSSFDIGDLFGVRPPSGRSRKGRDVRAAVELDLEQAVAGCEVTVVSPSGENLRVRIPPGADTGSIVRLKGKGQAGQKGAKNGDVIIETHVRPHPRIRRDGLNLSIALPVTLREVYNGATIAVETLSGTAKVKVPPRSQSGARLRLRGKGVRRKDRAGDFFIELDVKMPDLADADLGKALDACDSAYSQPVR